MMPDVESLLNEDEFIADTVDTLKEDVELYGKRECLKGAISKDISIFTGWQKTMDT